MPRSPYHAPPYRPGVIAEGVERRAGRTQRPKPPARGQPRGREVPGDRSLLCAAQDACPEQMPHVGRDGVDRSSVPIQRERWMVTEPERCTEAMAEFGRPDPPLIHPPAAEGLEEVRTAHRRFVGVCLGLR